MIGIKAGSLFGGRYRVIKSLGAGGMGAVYLAEDPRYEDFKVALKVIYPGILKSKDARERFRNEVYAAYRVNHKNIVRAFEYFDEGELQAFAMEYIDGGDLLERMKAGRLSPEEVTSILRQVAAGLEAVHAQGIIHRDLKPDNIMLTKDGIAKISDFGVARLRGSVTLTGAGLLVGTPKYLSPEYVETNECDQRGDIYALGVMGYEMVSGLSPFSSESETSIIAERFERTVRDLSAAAPHSPRELVKIVQKAMSFSVVLRYQNAGEMRVALEKVAQTYKFFSPDLVEPEELAAKRKASEKPVKKSSVLVNGVPLDQLEKIPAGGSRFRPMLLVAGAVLMIAGIASYFFTGPGTDAKPPSLADFFEPGMFVAESIESAGPPRTILWRTGGGLFALAPRNGCSVSPVTEDGRFSCGAAALSISAARTGADLVVTLTESDGAATKLRISAAAPTPLGGTESEADAEKRQQRLFGDLRTVIFESNSAASDAERMELALKELEMQESLVNEILATRERGRGFAVRTVAGPGTGVRWILTMTPEDGVHVFAPGRTGEYSRVPSFEGGLVSVIFESPEGVLTSTPLAEARPYDVPRAIDVRERLSLQFREIRDARAERRRRLNSAELRSIYEQIDSLDGELGKVESSERLESQY